MAETILVVEDDPSILRGLQMNLDMEGFRVLLARDGEEGLSLATQRQPDVIVMDLMLPRMQGTEMIRQLRTADQETPIVVLSALDQEGDKVLALSLGADDYIVKPFGTAELVCEVEGRAAPKKADAARTSSRKDHGGSGRTSDSDRRS